MFYSEGEKMTFEQAKYKYNCYARDVLGLVGELEIPNEKQSIKIIRKTKFDIGPGSFEDQIWILKNINNQKIAEVSNLGWIR